MDNIPFYEMPLYAIAQALDYLILHEDITPESLSVIEQELYQKIIPDNHHLTLDSDMATG